MLYDRTSSQVSVNDARMLQQLFTQREKQLMECQQQKLHLQHTMRAAYQAAQATIASIELPSPSEWGLNKNTDGEAWEVHWTTLLEATQACRELIRCGCKKGCMQRMLQVIESYSQVHCTLICFCGELCCD